MLRRPEGFLCVRTFLWGKDRGMLSPASASQSAVPDASGHAIRLLERRAERKIGSAKHDASRREGLLLVLDAGC